MIVLLSISCFSVLKKSLVMLHYSLVAAVGIILWLTQDATSTCPVQKDAKSHVTETSVFGISMAKSEDPVVIDSLPNTMKATSYMLKWKSPDTVQLAVQAYVIRYKQVVSAKITQKNKSVSWCYISTSGNDSSYYVTGLLPDTVYQVEIVSMMEKQKLSQPAMSSFRTGTISSPNPGFGVGNHPSAQPPFTGSNPTKPWNPSLSVPKSPVLTVTGISRSTISLMWYPQSNGGSPITGYKVQMKQSGRVWRTKKDTLPADTRTFAVRGLSRGVSYKFRVIAINRVGESPPSTAETVSTQTSRKQLNVAPELLDVGIKNSSQVCMTWRFDETQVTFTGFTISLLNLEIDKTTQKRVKNPKNPFCISAKLRSSTEYSVRMQAFNTRGSSPSSNEASFIMPAQIDKNTVISVVVHETSEPEDNHQVMVGAGDIDITDSIDDESHNADVWAKVSQRDAAILVAGAAFVFVILVLAVSAIAYNKLLAKAKNAAKGARFKSSNLTHSSVARFTGDDSCHSPTYSPSTNGCCSRNGCQRCDAAYNEMGEPHMGPDHMAPLCHYASMSCPYQHPQQYVGVDDWMRGAAGEFCHIVPNDARRPPQPNSVPQHNLHHPLLTPVALPEQNTSGGSAGNVLT